MVTRITSITAHQTPEGQRVSFTYSVIDDDGNLVKSNARHTVIVLDDEINECISKINEWVLSKVPQ